MTGFQRTVLGLWLSLLVAVSWPCFGTDPVKIVVSVPPQIWLVESIGGEQVTVSAILGPGDSPATYQPTDVQVTGILSARLFFRIGVPFESGAWFQALSASKKLEVVDTREGVELLTIQGEHRDHHNDESLDPHIWLSPSRLATQARTMARILSQVDPDHRAAYGTRLDRVLEELDQLDGELRDLLSPYAGRAFVVFHPSWGYFASDYGVRQVAIEMEGKEPSDRELTRLQSLAREESLETIFVQPQIRGKSAQALSSSLGAELEILDPLARDVPSNLRATAAKLVESFAR